jgi:hypothetical protein
MPSRDEIFELLDKAEQNISTFEDAVKKAKPKLDEVDPKLSNNYLDAASTAHWMLQTLHKDGPSAYRLVSLLATMDDLSRDAANASTRLLMSDAEHVANGRQRDGRVLASVILLSNSGTACNDIAELIMHATLRLVHAEEDLISSVAKQK